MSERAWNRAHEKQTEAGAGSSETVVRIRTRDVEALRRIIEPRLTDHVSKWRLIRTVQGGGDFQVVEYSAKLKKETTSDDLLSLVRSGRYAIIDAESSRMTGRTEDPRGEVAGAVGIHVAAFCSRLTPAQKIPKTRS